MPVVGVSLAAGALLWYVISISVAASVDWKGSEVSLNGAGWVCSCLVSVALLAISMCAVIPRWWPSPARADAGSTPRSGSSRKSRPDVKKSGADIEMATTVVPQPKSVQDCRPTLLTVVGVKKDNL